MAVLSLLDVAMGHTLPRGGTDLMATTARQLTIEKCQMIYGNNPADFTLNESQSLLKHQLLVKELNHSRLHPQSDPTAVISFRIDLELVRHTQV
jgi:hypothetical protein